MIETLFEEVDNIEMVRDEVAAILALEAEHQFELATAANNPQAKDFDIKVFVENDDPFQLVNDNDNPFPCVNVTLENTKPASGSTAQNHRNMTATFFVDIYAAGNTDSGEDAGFRASLKAWKTARIIRNILNAERYTYLNLQGVVGSRELKQFQSGESTNGNSAVRVKMVRITLEVNYAEDVEINNGDELLQIRAEISDVNGEVTAGALENFEQQ